MKHKALIKRFNELGKSSEKKGYHGDAAEYWFKAEVLIFLTQPVKRKRKKTQWNRFVGKYLREGKTMKQASKDFKKFKEGAKD